MTKKQQLIQTFTKVVFEMYGDAKTELNYQNDFQLLIAILMSAQTTDKQVNKVNEIFFEYLKTPQDGVNLWVEKITQMISSIGFYKTKAKNIFKTSQMLVEKNLENFETIEALTTLPWVGIKTAKVFLSVTKNMPFLAVDTHVHRVLNRVGIVTAKTPEETDKKAEKILPPEILAQLHQSLIFFGRYHCTARSPKCSECKLTNDCKYFQKQKK